MRPHLLPLLLSLVAVVTIAFASGIQSHLHERDLERSPKRPNGRAVYYTRQPDYRQNYDVHMHGTRVKSPRLFSNKKSDFLGTRLTRESSTGTRRRKSSRNVPHRRPALGLSRRQPVSSRPGSPAPAGASPSQPKKSANYIKCEQWNGAPLDFGAEYALIEIAKLHHSLVILRVGYAGTNVDHPELDMLRGKRYDISGVALNGDCKTDEHKGTWKFSSAEEHNRQLIWKGKIKPGADPIAAGKEVLAQPKDGKFSLPSKKFNPGADKKSMEGLGGNNCRTYVEGIWQKIKA